MKEPEHELSPEDRRAILDRYRGLKESSREPPSMIACGNFGPNGEWACWPVDKETFEELSERKGWTR